jgi:tetratricopeptide (TPR) repeat protein
MQNSYSYAILLNNIGIAYASSGDYEFALIWFLKGIGLEEKLGIEDYEEYASIIWWLGVSYKNIGEENNSKYYLKKAKKIYEELGKEELVKAVDEYLK